MSTKSNPRVAAVSGDLYVCPFLFDFLTVREVGKAACVCRAWREAAEDDELWRELYARTQVAETAMEDWARALAARPFGEDAVGWEVKVCNEEDNTWHQGLVVEYASPFYRVEYPDGSSRWESEQRTQGPWHRRGNSRLFFIGRLHDSIAGGNNHITSNNGSCSSSSSCGKMPAGPNMSSVSEGMWGRLRHGGWKEELKANACHVPAVELVRLMDHTDEVLDLKFSPDGTRLATCSRDMSILIYSVEEQEPKQEGDDGDKIFAAGAGRGVWGVGAGEGVEAKFGEEGSGRLRSSRQRLGQGRLSVRLIHRLRRSATASVCRIFWSPCSRFILSCLEEPHGDPFEPSSSELWDATLGSWLSRCRSQPFDVHAAWLPDGHHFVAGLDIHRDHSDVNAPFTQTLAIRRRPNLAPVFTCGDAVEARTFDPADRPCDRRERVDSSCMVSSPKPSGKAVPGAGRTAEEVGGVMWVDPAVEDDRVSIGGDGLATAAGAGKEEGSGAQPDDAAIPFTFGEAAATPASERRGITGRHFGYGGVQPQQQQQFHAMDIDDSNGHADHEDWWCSSDWCSDSKQEHGGGGGWGGLGSALDDGWMPDAGDSHDDGGSSAGASGGLSAGASGGLSADASAGSSAGASAGLGVGASAGSGVGASASGGAAALDGELFNFGDAIPPLMVVGINEHNVHEEIHGVADGGVQWVVEGSQTIHTADEADMPLVGEIRLNLGRNFGHFFQMSTSGQWACIATGKTPLMCHRIAFIPLHGPRLPPPPNALASNSNSNSGGEDNVFVFLEGRSKNAFVGGGAGSRSAVSDMEMEMEMETVECGGAILSLSISRDDRFAMANVRPFTDGALERVQNTAEALLVAPDISNEVELQVWDVETKKLLFKLGGHHAFTTKDCPFLIFAEQSAADPFGDYVCSGSEEHQVYVWHLRHRLLLRSMKGHSNVVNSVSWNPKTPGVLASCSDDGTAIIWGPKVR